MYTWIAIPLTRAEKRKLEKYCKKNGVTKGAAVRFAILEYLKNRREK